MISTEIWSKVRTEIWNDESQVQRNNIIIVIGVNCDMKRGRKSLQCEKCDQGWDGELGIWVGLQDENLDMGKYIKFEIISQNLSSCCLLGTMVLTVDIFIQYR